MHKRIIIKIHEFFIANISSRVDFNPNFHVIPKVASTCILFSIIFAVMFKPHCVRFCNEKTLQAQ